MILSRPRATRGDGGEHRFDALATLDFDAVDEEAERFGLVRGFCGENPRKPLEKDPKNTPKNLKIGEKKDGPGGLLFLVILTD